MSTQITWTASASTCCFYAARALLQQRPLADERLATAMGDSVLRLQTELSSLGISPLVFLEHVIPLSSTLPSNLELAQVALRKTSGSEHQVHATLVRGLLTDLEQSLDAALPRLEDELNLRCGPLQQQWEARGPGLLATMGRIAEEDLIPPSARMVLVHPVLGGGGVAHPSYNAVSFEAMLTDSMDGLPEVVRMAWLLGQLNLELPRFSDRLGAPRSIHLGALALVPITLAAAEQVELARCDATTIGRAMAQWCQPDTTPEKAKSVAEWWNVYHTSRPPLDIALEALQRMPGIG